MIGYVLISEVDALMYVALSKVEKYVSYGALVGITL
jgi:hypothetical protein